MVLRLFAETNYTILTQFVIYLFHSRHVEVALRVHRTSIYKNQNQKEFFVIICWSTQPNKLS